MSCAVGACVQKTTLLCTFFHANYRYATLHRKCKYSYFQGCICSFGTVRYAIPHGRRPFTKRALELILNKITPENSTFSRRYPSRLALFGFDFIVKRLRRAGRRNYKSKPILATCVSNLPKLAIYLSRTS